MHDISSTSHPPGPARPDPSEPARRSVRVGIGGPVGAGKTALVEALCIELRDERSMVVVTNDVFTTADAEALRARGALAPERIVAVETGCCPHTAVRDDVSANLEAIEDLEAALDPDLVLVESGGDNLTLTWSRALVDHQVFLLDVAGGDDVPAKGGPGISGSDLLVINKTDLAPHVGADVDRMRADAVACRDGRPVVTISTRTPAGVAPVAEVVRSWLDR